MAAKVKSRTLKKKKAEDKPRCGLCGKTRKLTKTECCGQWICDDEEKYVIFSYARNSCSRNHQRYTLCGNTMLKNTKVHGKTVWSAGMGLRQRCTSIMGQMNTTSRSWTILPPTYQPNVQNAG